MPSRLSGRTMYSKPPQFSAPHAAIWMMGALFCMVLLLGVTSIFNPEVIDDQVSLGALSAVAFLLVTSMLLGRYPGGARLRESIGARVPSPVLLPIAVAIGLLAQVPAENLRDWVTRTLPAQVVGEPAGVALTSHSRVESVALIVVLVGLVPLAEEVFFRGAIYGALRRSQYSPLRATVISALGFTLCHVNLQLLIPIGFVAALFGLLRATSGSLYPSLVAHMAFNAVPVVTSLKGLSTVEDWADRYGGSFSVALLGTILLHLVIASRSRQAELSREEESKPYLSPSHE